MKILAASAVSLVEAFRLRYEVYHRLGYVSSTAAALDIDEYDECSLPLGVFDGATEELVGTLRIIRAASRAEYCQVIRHVVIQSGDADLSARVFRGRGTILPSVGSSEIHQKINALAGSLPVCELSRLIVRPGHQGVGLWRMLLETGMALAWYDGPALLVGSCLARHVPIHARQGFRPLGSDNHEDYFASVRQTGCVVTCHPDDVPEPVRIRINKIMGDISEGGCHD